MATFVKDLLDRKGRDVVTVGPEVSIGEAAATLHTHKIGSVVVTDADGVVLGTRSGESRGGPGRRFPAAIRFGGHDQKRHPLSW